MERRRKSATPQPRGGINEDAATNVPTNSLPELPYVEETIENGGISIGIIAPLSECIAVAHEGRHTLAMLKRQKGESLAQLLSRLDLAIARAHVGACLQLVRLLAKSRSYTSVASVRSAHPIFGISARTEVSDWAWRHRAESRRAPAR